MKTLVIVNPTAGGGRCKKRAESVRDRLLGVFPRLEWAESTGQGTPLALASFCANSSCVGGRCWDGGRSTCPGDWATASMAAIVTMDFVNCALNTPASAP